MAGPTPHELGLSASPDLSWTGIGIGIGIGIEQPTPAGLGWASDPDLSWEAFEAAYPAGPQPGPPEPEAG